MMLTLTTFKNVLGSESNPTPIGQGLSLESPILSSQHQPTTDNHFFACAESDAVDDSNVLVSSNHNQEENIPNI